ncbi:MAG: hypothetical protein KOO60_10925 [Gemmatimonadales bacterium]|nr:hypothetical protein [Gemmatimonadales bacterium]
MLRLTLEPERFNMVAAGLQLVIGRPDVPKFRTMLFNRKFDEVLCFCDDMQVRLRCVRVFHDPHIKLDQWRIELGEVIETKNWGV